MTLLNEYDDKINEVVSNSDFKERVLTVFDPTNPQLIEDVLLKEVRA